MRSSISGRDLLTVHSGDLCSFEKSAAGGTGATKSVYMPLQEYNFIHLGMVFGLQA